MRRFGIIGNPLAQSPSTIFFEDYFHKNNIDAEFIAYELNALDNFESFLKSEGMEGLLVTIPFKEKAFALAHSHDLEELQAANMLDISHSDGKCLMRAYNTDFLAFQQDLLSVNSDVAGKALILGNGGASKAVAYALHNIGIQYDIISRIHFEGEKKWQNLDAIELKNYAIIINTTPLGMSPLEHEFLPLNYSKLKPSTIAYDLVYKPEKTLFLEKCEDAGCIIRNGKQMLMRIYDLALEKWNLLV